MIEITRAYALSRGVNLSEHECSCESCMRSAVLCPATQASIAAELGLDRPHDCAEKWFDDEIHICEACGTETRELKNNRLAKLKPPPDDGTTDICF